MKALHFCALCLAFPLAGARGQTDRVGSFDRQSIVIAFYRSPVWAATVRRQIAARDSAKRAGDTARVRELEAWGAGHQELAHQQLLGAAPLTNILDALRPALDSVARMSNLRRVGEAPVTDPQVTVVDVTPQLLDWLKADAKTREIIAQMPPRGRRP